MTNEPVDPEPTDSPTEPVQAEPVDGPTQQVEAEPNDGPTEPVDSPTEPVEARSVEAEPVDSPTRPIEAEPVDSPTASFPPPAGGGYEPAGGYQPPSAGFPPPGGFPPPPAGTGGWATRYGLVRPQHGRMAAGVCAAIGRATNTDPVLWRVLFAVFTLAGGAGLLAYVIGWLCIPAEGDTGSPVESLLGRGRSSTSPVLVIIVGVIAAGALGTVVYNGLHSAAILLAVILGAVILVSRGGRGPGTAPPTGPAPGAGTSVPPPPPTWAAPPPGAVPTGQPSTGYRPPFAPHGPYAPASRYPYPGLSYEAPPVAPPLPQPGPVPVRKRSRLGRLTLSLGLLAVGVLVVIDVAGARVPFNTYVGAVLAAVGCGLLIGAWFGRARWLIPIGLVLCLMVAAGAGSHPGRFQGGGDVTLTPTTVAGVEDSYHQNFGDFKLDLRNVDFSKATEPKQVTITMNAGDLTILLPPNVDTSVHAKLNAGDAKVFNARWGGLGTQGRDVSDDGADGPGGGTLAIDITLNLGDLEVRR